MARRKFIVSGAGIGGLTAALALLRAGMDVEILERAPELAEIGAGLHVSPNASRVLLALGLADELDEWGTPIVHRRVHVWNTGRAFDMPDQGTSATARYGAPYLLFHRADLQALLARAVSEIKPDALHLGSACVSFTQDENGVEVISSTGEVYRADALLGADGIHSVVRPALFGAVKPEFTGQMRWRAMLPIDRVPEELRNEAGTWVGPRGNVTMYPVRHGELFNFVASATRDWQHESWNEKGSVEECASDFVGWHELIQEVIRNIDVPYKWGLFLHPTLPEWSKERVTLLGDACHATLPALGQGANMAIEDAMVLARCVSANPDDLPTALKRYEDARVDRTTKIVNRSWDTLRRRDSSDLLDPEKAEAYIGSLYSPDRIRDWYDWIYDYDAISVPIDGEKTPA